MNRTRNELFSYETKIINAQINRCFLNCESNTAFYSICLRLGESISKETRRNKPQNMTIINFQENIQLRLRASQLNSTHKCEILLFKHKGNYQKQIVAIASVHTSDLNKIQKRKLRLINKSDKCAVIQLSICLTECSSMKPLEQVIFRSEKKVLNYSSSTQFQMKPQKDNSSDNEISKSLKLGSEKKQAINNKNQRDNSSQGNKSDKSKKFCRQKEQSWSLSSQQRPASVKKSRDYADKYQSYNSPINSPFQKAYQSIQLYPKYENDQQKQFEESIKLKKWKYHQFEKKSSDNFNTENQTSKSIFQKNTAQSFPKVNKISKLNQLQKVLNVTINPFKKQKNILKLNPGYGEICINQFGLSNKKYIDTQVQTMSRLLVQRDSMTDQKVHINTLMNTQRAQNRIVNKIINFDIIGYQPIKIELKDAQIQAKFQQQSSQIVSIYCQTQQMSQFLDQKIKMCQIGIQTLKNSLMETGMNTSQLFKQNEQLNFNSSSNKSQISKISQKQQIKKIQGSLDKNGFQQKYEINYPGISYLDEAQSNNFNESQSQKKASQILDAQFDIINEQIDGIKIGMTKSNSIKNEYLQHIKQTNSFSQQIKNQQFRLTGSFYQQEHNSQLKGSFGAYKQIENVLPKNITTDGLEESVPNFLQNLRNTNFQPLINTKSKIDNQKLQVNILPFLLTKKANQPQKSESIQKIKKQVQQNCIKQKYDNASKYCIRQTIGMSLKPLVTCSPSALIVKQSSGTKFDKIGYKKKQKQFNLANSIIPQANQSMQMSKSDNKMFGFLNGMMAAQQNSQIKLQQQLKSINNEDISQEVSHKDEVPSIFSIINILSPIDTQSPKKQEKKVSFIVKQNDQQLQDSGCQDQYSRQQVISQQYQSNQQCCHREDFNTFGLTNQQSTLFEIQQMKRILETSNNSLSKENQQKFQKMQKLKERVKYEEVNHGLMRDLEEDLKNYKIDLQKIKIEKQSIQSQKIILEKNFINLQTQNIYMKKQIQVLNKNFKDLKRQLYAIDDQNKKEQLLITEEEIKRKQNQNSSFKGSSSNLMRVGSKIRKCSFFSHIQDSMDRKISQQSDIKESKQSISQRGSLEYLLATGAFKKPDQIRSSSRSNSGSLIKSNFKGKQFRKMQSSISQYSFKMQIQDFIQASKKQI